MIADEARSLPAEWRSLPLRCVVVRTENVDPGRNPDRVYKYVDVSSVSSGSLRIAGWNLHLGADAPSRARREIRVGDVLFATVRPSLRRVAQVPVELDMEVCSTAFTVLQAKAEEVDPDFLFFAVADPDFVRRVSLNQRGSGYPAVRDGDVLSQHVALPPLAEQRAIAHVLRTVQRAREQTQQVIAAACELKRSLMRHLFTYGPVPITEADQVTLQPTDQAEVPSHWQVHPLGEVATLQRGKDLPQADRVEGPYPIVGSNGQVGTHSEPVATGPGVLVGRSGSVGNVVWANGDYWPLNTTLWVKDFHGNDPKFIFYLLTRFDFGAYASGVSVPTLNRNVVHPVRVGVPEISEQRDVASMLDVLERKIDAEQQRRDALDTLFDSLLHNLMTARLRVDHLASEFAR